MDEFTVQSHQLVKTSAPAYGFSRDIYLASFGFVCVWVEGWEWAKGLLSEPRTSSILRTHPSTELCYPPSPDFPFPFI